MEKFEISAALRDSLIAYLAQRPFREVADAIIALKTLQPVATASDQK